MKMTMIEKLNDGYLVFGDPKEFDSAEHFIQVAIEEHGDDDSFIENVRIEKCVYAPEGLPFDGLRPMSEAMLEFYNCYVGELKD